MPHPFKTYIQSPHLDLHFQSRHSSASLYFVAAAAWQQCGGCCGSVAAARRWQAAWQHQLCGSMAAVGVTLRQHGGQLGGNSGSFAAAWHWRWQRWQCGGKRGGSVAVAAAVARRWQLGNSLAEAVAGLAALAVALAAEWRQRGGGSAAVAQWRREARR
jgi:hypothetical protein